jgi:hypothetical protein
MELTYINSAGAAVTLKQLKPFFLTKLDGVGRIRQSINTFQAPEQDGAFYISSTVDMRNITIEGQILADTVDISYEHRRYLLQIFTPKQRGTLVFRNRQIACIVEEAGFSQGNIARAPAFFISLLCPSPFFEALETIREELVSWQGNFSFPLEIVYPPGIELGVRQPSQIITIENIGDVPCGCEIVFHALGSLSTPELSNVVTGEFIRINANMTAGEEYRIYTHFAGKKVTRIMGTAQSNAFSLLDVGSAFLQLAAGTNTLRYDAADNMDLLDVSIFYRPQFLGV